MMALTATACAPEPADGAPSAEVEAQPRCIGCCLCAINCPDSAIQVGLNGSRYLLFDY